MSDAIARARTLGIGLVNALETVRLQRLLLVVAARRLQSGEEDAEAIEQELESILRNAGFIAKWAAELKSLDVEMQFEIAAAQLSFNDFLPSALTFTLSRANGFLLILGEAFLPAVGSLALSELDFCKSAFWENISEQANFPKLVERVPFIGRMEEYDHDQLLHNLKSEAANAIVQKAPTVQFINRKDLLKAYGLKTSALSKMIEKMATRSQYPPAENCKYSTSVTLIHGEEAGASLK